MINNLIVLILKKHYSMYLSIQTPCCSYLIVFTHLRNHLSIEQYRLLILGVVIYDSMYLSMSDLGYHLKVYIYILIGCSYIFSMILKS